MPVNLNLPQGAPVTGIEFATLAAGVKRNGTPDMVVARFAEGSTCAAVFTQSAFCAAPVTICKQQLLQSQGAIRALLINSGNANAGTGEPGIVMARGHCDAVASTLSIPASSVLPFSTGVIGQLLPDDIMRQGIEKAAVLLESTATSDIAAWQSAACGIMTTDTVPKLTSQTIELAGQTVTVCGMAKGSGMIQPDMATMLSYVFTDAAIEQIHLEAALKEAVDVSFNAITVDSDTSTNDSCVLVATGGSRAAAPVLDPGNANWAEFMQALVRVFTDLAQAIVRDAEGATKFISVQVDGGVDRTECKQVAYAIANSPLVKTAMFASDANVGRLLMAIGKAGVEDLDASRVSVSLGDVLTFEAGGIAQGYTEERGAAVMACEEIDVLVDLGRGAASATVYTSDLSHDYVSINADYRS
ncbi:MAG: bifunctional glutamate N-acetyltransferase/amino-acid acetyltransferase ArgJ [Granulosicoccus sp.]